MEVTTEVPGLAGYLTAWRRILTKNLWSVIDLDQVDYAVQDDIIIRMI